MGIDPPKWHDVGGLLLEHAAKMPVLSAAQLQSLAAALQTVLATLD